MHFRLLGDFEGRLSDRVLDLGHARQKSVLAVLLVEVNRGVSIDRLVDRVWGENHPQRPRDAVHAYMSRLRRALAPAADVSITRRSGGYSLTIDPLAVDLHRFQHLVTQARAAHLDEDAAVLFEEAFGLWRGRPSPAWTYRGWTPWAKNSSGSDSPPNSTTRR